MRMEFTDQFLLICKTSEAPMRQNSFLINIVKCELTLFSPVGPLVIEECLNNRPHGNSLQELIA